MPSAASRRLEPRLPAPPPPPDRGRRDASRPSLAQFVVLSMALHALFILLFGSPAGSSREGRAMWGTLDVTIRGPLLDSGIGLRMDRGESLQLPGAQLLEKRERKREAAPPPPPPARPEARREEPDLEAPRVVDIPAPAPLAPIVPATAPPPEVAPAPRIDPVRTEAPRIPVPAIDWTPAPESSAAPRIETPVIEAPRIEAPRRARAPVVPSPMLQESGAVAPASPIAPPVEIAAPPPRPAPVIEAPSPLLQSPAPATTQTLAPAAEVAPPTQPARPEYQPPAAARPPEPAAARPSEPAAAKAAEPAATKPSEPARRESPIFNNRKAPPADVPVPGTGPRIDLDAAKARAREIAREGTGNRALLPFPMPPAPERKTKEQIAIEKARKPDCKDAYKGLGLLAVVPLIANEFGEGNCRW